MKSSRMRLANLVAAFGVVVLALALAPATGWASGPRFTVLASAPTYAATGEHANVHIVVRNTGNARSHSPVVVTDTVGPGLGTPSVDPEGFISDSVLHPEIPEEEFKAPECESPAAGTFTCIIPVALPPGGTIVVPLLSTVEASTGETVVNRVTASAIDVPAQTLERQTAVGPAGPFAITSFAGELLDSEGGAETGAGATPYQFTTSFEFSTKHGEFLNLLPVANPVEHFKDVTAHLPAGFIGDPTVTPKCTAGQLGESSLATGLSGCPIDSQLGIADIDLGGRTSLTLPVYNMIPPPGAATELSFSVLGTIVTLVGYVRPGDHGIDVVSSDTSTTLAATSVRVTVWGDPASPAHDGLRGACLVSAGTGAKGGACPASIKEQSFLRLPTSCSGGPLPFGAEASSWEKPDTLTTASFGGATVSACDNVPFEPSIFTQPTAAAANSPTGVAVQLSLPQSTSPKGLATSDLEKAVVTLPEGMALNPSSADGLQACDDAHLKLDSGEPADCPEASKVGTVLLHTPLLENPIEGFVWLRTQNSSDPMSGEMYRLTIELRDDRHGIDIKLPGGVQANPVTGRLTSTFDNAPQLPFSDMTLHFKSGARAPLTTPFSCQAQTTEADLYPWARPSTPVHTNMTFQLTSGPENTPCTSTPGFNPGFSAGVSSVQAGAFTPFLATFSRKDSDQSMQRVTVKMPEGLLGSLVGLPLCDEAQANAGTCSQASEIGSVTAGAGDGPTPFYVTGGHVYMTGPYEGAPFGLSVVVPAKAGPFDLGTVVVRAKVEVNIHTAQLQVTTDPLPQIVGGVPVNLRLVNVTIDRPNFTYNPTDCNPTEVAGSMTGGQGAVATLSNHFQVTNCGALSFKPSFKVSTSGKTSRQNGASLDAKLAYPKTKGVSNIAKVKVSLPKQLPSRLTTLQKACPAATFEANPAACPPASKIGTATAVTPVLPVPLSGPVYFVSHGGEAFPDLVVVLQGYGVTVNLVGTTFISKAGITSTTFKQIPDVPVGTFDLKLPQGPNSALAANGNLCTSKLLMPTAFIAQDGAEVHQSTRIATSGCVKHKVKHKKKK